MGKENRRREVEKGERRIKGTWGKGCLERKERSVWGKGKD